jgi:hypothetical protein
MHGIRFKDSNSIARLPVDGFHVKVTRRIDGGDFRTNGGEMTGGSMLRRIKPLD